MADDSFILLDLKEGKSKKIAQVISNETSRKILAFLAERKEATETEIAKKLNIPISTVHYNLSMLKQVNLVSVDEFHYSEKGKEVDHYKLSKKYVIIAPESTKMDFIKEKLKKILPVFLISIVGAGLIKLFFGTFGRIGSFTGGKVMETTSVELVSAETSKDIGEVMSCTPHPELNIVLYFLVGAIFAIIIYFLVDFFWKKK